jgi:trehalose/maltose transport system substrate-binding protein
MKITKLNTFLKKALISLAMPLAMVGAVNAQGVTVTISCGSVGQDFEFCKRHTDEWAKKTGNTVNLFTAPQSTTDILALYRQLFAARSSDIDIIMADVVWPGMIKDHLIDLRPFTNGAEKNHFPAIVSNNTLDGKLLAMPWFTDAGLLYYRKDLLDRYGLTPPKTWDELTVAAKTVQDAERAAGNNNFHGFVFQGRAYEGLTCNAIEWVSSFGGGSIVESDGRISINNPQAAKALTTAASWVGTIAPRGVLNYAEEEARGVFQSGNAAFMRNWPYAWSLGNGEGSAIRGKIGVAPLPTGEVGGKSAAALGGWQLAVSRYSRNPEVAADLVMYLTSKEVQKDRAIHGSYNPTIQALYQDASVLNANPFMGELYDVFISATARPSTITGLKYNEVSNAFWNAAHDVMSGSANAQARLATLERRLNQIRRGPNW